VCTSVHHSDTDETRRPSRPRICWTVNIKDWKDRTLKKKLHVAELNKIDVNGEVR